MKTLLASLLLFFSLTLTAQSEALSKKETKHLINSYCDLLTQLYFNKELGKEITATLKQKLKAGEFYNVTNLPGTLTNLMRELTHDVHFYIGVQEPVNDADDTEENLKPTEASFFETSLINNTIGYVKIREFKADETSLKHITAELQKIKGCQSLIFDLSKCPGGDGSMGGFIHSHLFAGTDYQNLLLKKCGGENDWHQSEVAYPTADSLTFFDVPVFVIISGGTASAAEYFALILQETKRATILGSTTAGAGNPVTMVSFDNYFAYIPICEIVTKDGKSIEGKGVAPDVALTGDKLVEETISYIKASN